MSNNSSADDTIRLYSLPLPMTVMHLKLQFCKWDSQKYLQFHLLNMFRHILALRGKKDALKKKNRKKLHNPERVTHLNMLRFDEALS